MNLQLGGRTASTAVDCDAYFKIDSKPADCWPPGRANFLIENDVIVLVCLGAVSRLRSSGKKVLRLPWTSLSSGSSSTRPGGLPMGAIASLGIRVVNRSVVDALGSRMKKSRSGAEQQARTGTSRTRIPRRTSDAGGPLPNRNSRRRRSRDRFFDAQRCRPTSKAGSGTKRDCCACGSALVFKQLKSEADQVVVLHPGTLRAVGQWYLDFRQNQRR